MTHLVSNLIDMEETNFKGLLQIHCQKAKVALPRYSCTQNMKNNCVAFIANLKVLGQSFTSEMEFSSKKQAEKNAAKVALLKLGILTADNGKLVLSGESAPTEAGDGGYDGQKVGQACVDGSPVLTATGVPSASVSSVEVSEKGSGRDPQISSPKVQRSSAPFNAQTPVSTKINNPVSFKNILQERAQKLAIPLPQYETTERSLGFVSTVTFDGLSFKSQGFSLSKKMAEQNAASIAIKVLTSEKGTCGESPELRDKAPSGMQSQTPPATSEMCDAKVPYKNLLQENCQQRGHKRPVYSTIWQGILYWLCLESVLKMQDSVIEGCYRTVLFVLFFP